MPRSLVPTRFRFPTRLRHPTAADLLPVGLAHAVALVAVSYSLYLLPPPSRVVWWLAELLLSAVAWPAAGWYLRRAVGPAWAALDRRDRRLFAGLSVGLGTFVSRWWAGAFVDSLWIQPEGLRPVLRAALAAAEAAVLAAGYAGLLAGVVRLMPLAPPSLVGKGVGGLGGGSNPSPDPSPRRGGEKESPLTPNLTLRRSEGRSVVLAFAVFLAAVLAFAGWYVRREQTVHPWDLMVYWVRTAETAEAIRADPLGVWDRLRASVPRDDYGLTPSVLPAAVMAVAGTDRTAYVTAVAGLYLPAVGAAAWLFVRRFGGCHGPLAAAAPLAVLATLPVVWVPLARGYLDVGGAALAVLALLVYLSGPAAELRWTHVVAVAGLLVLMVLFRRWYSFFAVAFLLAAGAEAVARAAVPLARRDWRTAWREVVPVVATGGLLATAVTSVAAPWVWRVLTTDYATDYAAYKSPGDLLGRAWTATGNVGGGHLAAAAAGLAVMIATPATRRAGLFLAAIGPVTVIHFSRTQNLNPHHCGLLVPVLIVPPAVAAVVLARGVGRWAGWAVVAGLAGYGAAACWAVVGPGPQAAALHDRLGPLAPPFRFPPQVRDDLPELRRLLLFLAAETDRTGGPVAVVSSAFGLNPTTLAVANRSLRECLFPPDRLATMPEVDRVSTFPVALLRAELVVVADPPQTHLAPAEQQVVVIPAEMLLKGKGVGRAFDRLPETFRLDGMMVRVFRRARPIPDADVRELSDRLRRAHPDRPGLFTPPPEAFDGR